MSKIYRKQQLGTASVIFAIFVALSLSTQANSVETRDVVDPSFSILTGPVITSRVPIPTENSRDGNSNTVTFLQMSPKANPEYVCLAVLDRGTIDEMDCFPRKTSMTPLMY